MGAYCPKLCSAGQTGWSIVSGCSLLHWTCSKMFSFQSEACARRNRSPSQGGICNGRRTRRAKKNVHSLDHNSGTQNVTTHIGSSHFLAWILVRNMAFFSLPLCSRARPVVGTGMSRRLHTSSVHCKGGNTPGLVAWMLAQPLSSLISAPFSVHLVAYPRHSHPAHHTAQSLPPVRLSAPRR